MLLNHVPVSLSSNKVACFSQKFTDYDAFHALKERLAETHFARRRGENILLFPYNSNVNPIDAEEKEFDLTIHPDIAKSLIANALKKKFVSANRAISKASNPIKFALTNKNLLSVGTEYFAIFPEYGFEVQSIASGDMEYLGILINFSSKFSIIPEIQSIYEKGISLKGLYLLMSDELADKTCSPEFRYKLAGSVDYIDDGYAYLLDSRVDKILLADAKIEANFKSFSSLGQSLLGSSYPRFMKDLDVKLHSVSGAKNQKERLEKLFNFADLQGEIVCCNGLSAQIERKLTPIYESAGLGNYQKASTPECSLSPGGTHTVSWPVDAAINTHGPFDAASFDKKTAKIALIFPEQYKGRVDSFAAQLRDGVVSNSHNAPYKQGFIRKYRLTDLKFEFYSVDSALSKAEAYRNAALLAARGGVDSAIVVVSENDKSLYGAESPYFATKATLLSQGVPTQMVRIETLQNTRSLPWSLNNIALSLYAKLGGIPWALSVRQRLTHEIIIGIGSTFIGFDRISNRERLVGITTVFAGDGKYLLGNATREVNLSDYTEALLGTLRTNISELSKRFGWQKGDHLRIIFHQSFKKYRNEEAAAVKGLAAGFADYDIEFALVHIGDDHGWRIFDPNGSGVKVFQETKGEMVAPRGMIVAINPFTRLLTLTGPQQLKTTTQGCPRPMKISIHKDSTFSDIDYITKQIYDLTFMSWRSFFPSTEPVTIKYSKLVVELLGHFKSVPYWNPDTLFTRLRDSRWFL